MTGVFGGCSKSGLAVSRAVARPKRAAWNVTAEFRSPQAIVRCVKTGTYGWRRQKQPTGSAEEAGFLTSRPKGLARSREGL